MEITNKEIEEHKEDYCNNCGNFHSCCDLDGDLINEQVIICIEGK